MGQLELLLITAVISIIPGQLVRIPLFGQEVSFTVSDIFVLILAVAFLFYFFFNRIAIVIPKKIMLPTAVFSLFATSSTVFALNQFSPKEIFVSSLFLLRFLLYFSVMIITLNVVKREKMEKWVNIFLSAGTILVFLGFLQLLFVPNLLFLAPYGWDPHKMRIVSSFLDPNFVGIVFVFLASFSLSSYLFKKNLVLLFVFLSSSIAVLLTFSRSSYLAFLCALLVIGILKSFRITSFAILIFLVSFIFIPQARERVTGAITFDETVKARIESWQRALLVFKDHFLVGVGFNTYRYTQASYGFFENDQDLGGHSGAGSDSSLLLVAATTGVFGLAAFMWILISIWSTVAKSSKRSFVALGTSASFIGLVVHSQFVNSLFFPQIMLLFWFFVGIVSREDNLR